MFIGSYTHAIDDKQRLKLPSNFRQKITADTVVLAKGDGEARHITLYPWETWQEYVGPIRKKALHDYKYRQYMRVKFSSAAEVKIDSQGRVLLPKSLLDFSGISKDVEIIGVGDYVELWAPERFGKEVEEVEELSGQFLDYMARRESD